MITSPVIQYLLCLLTTKLTRLSSIESQPKKVVVVVVVVFVVVVIIDGLRNLPLKFGQKWVSNSRDVVFNVGGVVLVLVLRHIVTGVK